MCVLLDQSLGDSEVEMCCFLGDAQSIFSRFGRETDSKFEQNIAGGDRGVVQLFAISGETARSHGHVLLD